MSVIFLRKIVESKVHNKEGGTCLGKFAKALREFLSLVCTIIVVYLEIWELIR